MNLAAKSRATSSPMDLCLSSLKRQRNCLTGLKLQVNIKSVLSEFPQYTWHVRRFPCKDVMVLTDELDERAFLFGIQVSTDTELLR